MGITLWANLTPRLKIGDLKLVYYDWIRLKQQQIYMGHVFITPLWQLFNNQVHMSMLKPYGACRYIWASLHLNPTSASFLKRLQPITSWYMTLFWGVWKKIKFKPYSTRMFGINTCGVLKSQPMLVWYRLFVYIIQRRHKTIYCITEYRDQYKANGLAITPVWKIRALFFLFLFYIIHVFLMKISHTLIPIW